MFRRTVTSPDGTKWKLGRRWLPRWKKLGRADVGDFGPDVPDFGGDDLGIVGTIVLAIFLVIAAIFLVLVLFNVVAIAIELMIFIVVALAGLFGRVVLRRPWTVFAKSTRRVHERQAVGWRGSRAALDELASELQAAPGHR
jgi:hypothetical protein